MPQAICIVCILALMCVQAGAYTVLFDFETQDEIGLWHNEHATVLGADKKLERSESFAASGKSSMRFSTGAWRPEEHGGAQTWPAFECKPPITDWSKCDRLVWEMVNVTDAPQKVMVFISDSVKPTRSGVLHREIMPPHTYARAVVNIKSAFAAQGLNPADVHVMHFFSENPPEDLVVHLDRFLLVEPGEEIPALPGAFLQDVAGLHRGSVGAMCDAFEQSAQRLRQTPDMPLTIQAWVGSEITRMQGRLDQLRASLDREDESVLELPKQVQGVQAELDGMAAVLGLRIDFDKIRARVEAAPGSAEGLAAGFATSMQKVLPRAGVPALDVRPSARVTVARNERESLQLVVVPFERDLEQVQVKASGFRAGDGTPLAADCISAPPVGYVETTRTPPYGSSHIGWCPDPILTFMDKADIARGDAQSFWVNVDVPKDQAPGVYRGRLEVLAEGKPLMAFDLSVRVYAFTMPDASPLPMAITFWPHDYSDGGDAVEQEDRRQEADYPIKAWRKHKAQWADFLADYYITIDSLYAYGGWEPQFDDLERLHEAGKLGTFNLGYYTKCPEGEEETKAWRAATIDVLRPRYEKARALGILDHAYIYGCDEHPEDEFPWVEKAAAEIKAAFPDVMVMTTTYDHSYGLQTVIKSMDAWCPLTPRYNREPADEVRAQGKQVWWYICCGPHHPFANMFVEYPAIDGRILMGAMTAKFRPDGFLYYQISIWNSRHPISSGPFTDWDPRSWTTYHGDGSWTCAGPDGTPLPTVRLENFRDGLEDYAYYLTLEATVEKVKGSAQLSITRGEWLRQAEDALQVPAGLVESGAQYSQDPDDVYRWRSRLAELIEGADTEPAYPW